MMAQAAKDINWRYFGDALPAFITLAVMPFTYSIAYGLIAGIISYMIINTIPWLIEIISMGKIVVPDKELRDPWTWKVKGGLLPAWIVRASKGKKDFWHEDSPVVTPHEDSASAKEDSISKGPEGSEKPVPSEMKAVDSEKGAKLA